ncbi:MAG: hypothetical protein HC836_22775 [Richelia sp. RM2_1_2]|nr:hypothetical protein [Richelia sp. RM2_1_2]
MNSNEKFRTEAEIIEIKKHYSPPKHYRNFLIDEEIDRFKEIYNHIPKRLAVDAYRNSFRSEDNHPVFQEISLWARQRFHHLLGDFNVSTIFFYESPTPASATDSTIHADLWDDERTVDKTILIPLVIEPNLDTFTIIFEQHYYHYGAAYIGKVGNKQVFGPTVILPKNYDKIDRLKENHYFNKEIYHKHLTHRAYSNFYGLTICDIIKWRIGGAIVFNRTHLHCCNDYFDLTKRAWLSIWTHR